MTLTFEIMVLLYQLQMRGRTHLCVAFGCPLYPFSLNASGTLRAAQAISHGEQIGALSQTIEQ